MTNPETVTRGGSGLVFVNTYGAGVTATFRSEIIAAENYFQSHFTNACTINCSFDLQQLNPAFSGQNNFSPIIVSYAALRAALTTHATSPDDLAAVAALATLSDPSGGQGFEVPLGEARILGLAGPGSGVDDAVVLNTVYWTAQALQNNPNDAIAVIEHEVSEGAMGRIGSLGLDGPWAPMDLFRYTAAGQRDFTGGRDGLATYFSPNGDNVATGLRFHNSINSSGQFDGFDLSDWDQVGADANAHDPFGPGGPGAGDPGKLSLTDLRMMDVLGWTPKMAPSFDFNRDGFGDVLVQNPSTGSVVYANMANGSFSGWAAVANVPGWSVIGAGDFNGDGFADVVIQNQSGQIIYANMANGIFSGWGMIANVPGWNAVGVGDLNGNGFSDVVIQNPTSGQIIYANMANGSFSGWGMIASVPGWQVVGVADINGDGFADVVIQSASGQIDYANMANGSFSGWAGVANVPGWQVIGAGDINGDGFADVVIQSQSGQIDYINMANGVASGFVAVGNLSGYRARSVEDVNGDGYADIVVQNQSTGQIQYANMANGVFSNWVGVSIAPGYLAASVAGLNGSDLTIANNATLELVGASNANVTFTGTTGTLKLDDSLGFAGQVSGLTAADALDLSDVRFGANTKATFSGNTSGGTLAVTDGSNIAHIALLGDYTHSGWTLSGDGSGGTTVVDPPLTGSPSGGGGPSIAQQVALLNQYMASTLTDSGFERGSAPTPSDPVFAQAPLLTNSPAHSAPA